jgi:hypothetical protein
LVKILIYWLGVLLEQLEMPGVRVGDATVPWTVKWCGLAEDVVVLGDDGVEELGTGHLVIYLGAEFPSW